MLSEKLQALTEKQMYSCKNAASQSYDSFARIKDLKTNKWYFAIL